MQNYAKCVYFSSLFFTTFEDDHLTGTIRWLLPHLVRTVFVLFLFGPRRRVPKSYSSCSSSCGKGKGPVLDIALLHDEDMSAQERFTVSDVAADWHELMIPQRIIRPSVVRASMQTYHPLQSATLGLQPRSP